MSNSRKNTVHGKSYTALTLLGTIVRHSSDVNISITVADYKNSFKQFHGTKNFYGYTKAVEGIKTFYEELQRRIENNENSAEIQEYPIRYIFIDEMSSLSQAQHTKAEKDKLLEMISNLLNLGREYNMRTIIRTSKTEMRSSLSGRK